MNKDILLYWLTSLGEGSWSRFRDAVVEAQTSEEDPDQASRRIRVHLSDFGYADFFIGGSRLWRVRRPVLVGLCGTNDAAILSGARTPKLISELKEFGDKVGCQIEIRNSPDALSDIFFRGSKESFEALAADTKIPYIPEYALDLCRSLYSIPDVYYAAAREPELAKWKVRSLNLDTRKWVAERLPNTAREYTSSYGEFRYFICDFKGDLRSLPKREAVYAAAWLNDLSLGSYGLQTYKLTTPIQAPLPELYARVACLCSGRPSRIEGEYIVYEDVAPNIAAAILVLAGQPHPGFPTLT